jgi:hypothetical protein
MIFDMTKRKSGSDSGIDVISGTVTASSGKLVLPVPRGYYFVALLSTVRALAYGDLPEIMHISSAGNERWCARKVPENGGGSIATQSNSATPPWWISVSDAVVTVNASNNNTSGTIKAGDEYFYLAWRDA